MQDGYSCVFDWVCMGVQQDLEAIAGLPERHNSSSRKTRRRLPDSQRRAVLEVDFPSALHSGRASSPTSSDQLFTRGAKADDTRRVSLAALRP